MNNGPMLHKYIKEVFGIKLMKNINNSISNNWSLGNPAFFCKTFGKKSKEAKAWVIP